MRNWVSALVMTLILVSALVAAFDIQPVRASGTIYIRADGSIDPPGVSISSFDNVTYTLTADIYDSIVVERRNIIVDGAGHTLIGPAAEGGINLVDVGNVTIKNIQLRAFKYGIYLNGASATIFGNNITDSDWHGIYLDSASATIYENRITNSGKYGIYLYDAAGTIYENLIPENTDGGIFLYSAGTSIFRNNITNNGNAIYSEGYSRNNDIQENLIVGNGMGIILGYDSDNNIISNNNITNNGRGIQLGVESSDNNIEANYIANNSITGIRLTDSVNNNLSSNHIIGNGVGISSIGGWKNIICRNNVTANNGWGISFFNRASINEISGNYITNNGGGIGIDYSNDITVEGNIITKNEGWGVRYSRASGNNISSNCITDNFYGIGVYGDTTPTPHTSSAIISQNEIMNNDYGIDFWLVESSYINHNNFIDNTQHVNITISYANTWDDGYPSAGNYWSNYTDTDLYRGLYQNETGSDGVWDYPYVIDSNNEDRYPLTNPLPRDIAVIDVTPTQIVVNQNSSLNVNVTVANQGNFLETFNVTLNAEPSTVGYWKFDEGIGATAYDYSGNNNSGVVSGATWTTGKTGTALQFDGIDDYVEVQDSPRMNLTASTITGWVKIPSVGAVNRGTIVSKGGCWNRRGWMLATNDYNKIRFYWQSTADRYIETQTVLSYDEWHHIAAVIDGSEMRVFIDGVQDPNAALNVESADTTNPIRIGRSHFYGNLPFNGTIDEVQVFSEALTEENIRALVAGSFAIQTQIATLQAFTSTTITFTWNTTGFARGKYVISAYAESMPGEANLDNNIYVDGIVTIYVPVHDIAIMDVVPSKTIVGQTFVLSINATVENKGDYAETFNVTAYANTTFFPKYENLILPAGDHLTLTFLWNTTGFAMGNYTLNVTAKTIPGETDTFDNTLISWIFVTVPGDVDGDRDVDIFDIVLIARSYGSEEGEPRYIANCDIDGDGDIDIFDIVIAAGNYGKNW